MADAGVVEVVVIDTAIDVGAVLGSIDTGNAGGGTFLAKIGNGSIDELTIGTGGSADISSDLFVVNGSRPTDHICT